MTDAADGGGVRPVRLTPGQRAVLLDHARLLPAVRERLAAAGSGTQPLALTPDERACLTADVRDLAAGARAAVRRRARAILTRLTGRAAKRAPPVPAFWGSRAGADRCQDPDPAADRGVYQFRVTLLDAPGPVWRRLQVTDVRLHDLARYLTAALGWDDPNTYAFHVDGVRYGSLPAGIDLADADARAVRLAALLPPGCPPTAWAFRHDAAAGWRHEVGFEGRVARWFAPPIDPGVDPDPVVYPDCVGGAGACPAAGGGPFSAAAAVERMREAERYLDWNW